MTETTTILRTASLDDVITLAFKVEDIGFPEEDSFLLAGFALTGTNPSKALLDVRREGRVTSRQVLTAYRVLRDAGCFL